MIILGNKESELAAIIKNIESELSFFSTRAEKMEFLKFTLKNTPFGVDAAIRGVSKASVSVEDVVKRLAI